MGLLGVTWGLLGRSWGAFGPSWRHMRCHKTPPKRPKSPPRRPQRSQIRHSPGAAQAAKRRPRAPTRALQGPQELHNAPRSAKMPKIPRNGPQGAVCLTCVGSLACVCVFLSALGEKLPQSLARFIGQHQRGAAVMRSGYNVGSAALLRECIACLKKTK